MKKEISFPIKITRKQLLKLERIMRDDDYDDLLAEFIWEEHPTAEDDDITLDVLSFFEDQSRVVFDESPPVIDYSEEIVWKPKFLYPRKFNNYDAWLAELYGRNISKKDKYLTGVHSRFAEKVGHYLTARVYGFEQVTDLNLYAALKHKLKFEDVVMKLSYDLEAIHKNEIYHFDVKARINPGNLDLFVKPQKIHPNENLLFIRTFGDITKPKFESVGYITYEMFTFMFGNQDLRKLEYVPGYFAFNNTIDVYLEYKSKKNPATVPLMMRDVQLLRKQKLNRQEQYWIDEYKDYSQNPDIEYWEDLFSFTCKKAG